MWKDFIVAQFHGLLPPPKKIYDDLNKAWGKFGNITIRTMSETTCLILIPCLSTREWALRVGYWQADNVAFTVYPWTPEVSLELPELSTAPTWAILKNIPPQMYSLKGISVIASAIGEPLHTEKSKLDPYHFGGTKVKVEINLDSSPLETIIIRDARGNSAKVKVEYPRLPPKCCNCGRFGHLIRRCPKPMMKNPPHKEMTPKGTAATTTKISLAASPPATDPALGNLHSSSPVSSDSPEKETKPPAPQHMHSKEKESPPEKKERHHSSPPVINRGLPATHSKEHLHQNQSNGSASPKTKSVPRSGSPQGAKAKDPSASGLGPLEKFMGNEIPSPPAIKSVSRNAARKRARMRRRIQEMIDKQVLPDNSNDRSALEVSQSVLVQGSSLNKNTTL